MKNSERYLRDVMIIQEKAGKIREIMNHYNEDNFDSEISVNDLTSLINHLDSIISVKKKRKWKEGLENDIEAIRYLIKLQQ